MTTFIWSTPGTADTLATGAALNALADGAGIIGAEIDNSTDRKTLMAIRFVVDTDITSVGVDARLDFYLIAAEDGTNYPDPPGATAADVPQRYWVSCISSVKRAGTVTNFLSGFTRPFIIPPRKFKILPFNELGAGLPANNNAVFVGYRFNLADV